METTIKLTGLIIRVNHSKEQIRELINEASFLEKIIIEVDAIENTTQLINGEIKTTTQIEKLNLNINHIIYF